MGDTRFHTAPAELEAALSELVASAPGWAATPLARRAALGRECARRAATVAEAITADAVAYKGAYETGDGEEMTAWAATPAVLNAYSLEAVAAGAPRGATQVRWRIGAGTTPPQAVAHVFPASFFEHLLFTGYSGELWLLPGAAATSGGEVVQGGAGEVCLVLGAGNQAVVAVSDVALKCLIHGAVCILKMNPINEWAGPHIERSFAPLVAAGALRVVYGGADAGKALTAHALVQSVHITGSDKTYDAIVWGGAPKARDATPSYPKPVSLRAPNQLPAGPEWATQRIQRKADLGNTPNVFQPTGTAGQDGDKMTCILCARPPPRTRPTRTPAAANALVTRRGRLSALTCF